MINFFYIICSFRLILLPSLDSFVQQYHPARLLVFMKP